MAPPVVDRGISSGVMTRERLTMVGIFCTALAAMAAKPILLHLTRDGDVPPLPEQHMNLWIETAKLIICYTVILTGSSGADTDKNIWCGVSHTGRFALPAGMYLVMNLIAVHYARVLNPPTFQLIANTKILATAFASWVLLRRTITSGQWVALVLLTCGVMLGQWRGDGAFEAKPLEMLVMTFNSCISAAAGVFIEKALKSEESKALSIFGTGVHMSTHTILLNASFLSLFGHAGIFEARWPNRVDSIAIFNEAINGILMSLLMRRLDSIAKNFAFSTSVFVTALFSAVFLNYHPTILFFIGAGLTAIAGVMYVWNAAPPSKPPVVKEE